MPLKENLRKLRMISEKIGRSGLLQKAQYVEELSEEIINVLEEISEHIEKLEGEKNGG